MTTFVDTRYLPPSAAAARVVPAIVSLVGAGPGDPDLLTVKALRLLQQAGLVVYDKLVSPRVLALANPQAEQIYVGKHSGHHTLSQDEIIALLLRLARGGRSVLRLKGGDPYIFGRGGEEAQALAAAGIAFEVVPGITAAQGMAAACGIPLTHRDHATQVVYVTGHLRDGAGERGLELDWGCLARPHQTLVIYMGIATVAHLCQRLQQHGLAADTPAAMVENATMPTQRTIVGSLHTLPALAQDHAVRPPALIVIGGVVALHGQLDRTLAGVPARAA